VINLGENLDVDITNRIEIPQEMSGLLRKHYDSIIADDSLTDLDVILISINLIERVNKKAGARYDDIKKLFVSFGRKEENFKANIFQAKNKVLKIDKEDNITFLSKGLKRLEKILGQIGKSQVYVVKSGEYFTARKLFEEFLINEIKDKELLLVDPYISPSTLFPFSVLKGRITNIKILTSNIYEDIKFEEYKKQLEKETNINVEVKDNKDIHDRFLISGEKCWSIGSSIKDLGNKDTMIIEIKGVTNSLRDLFQLRWDEK
jgi:hypothetical protein